MCKFIFNVHDSLSLIFTMDYVTNNRPGTENGLSSDECVCCLVVAATAQETKFTLL